MKKYILPILSLIAVLLFSSCDNFEGEQEIPAYIKVSGFNVVANPTYYIEQGEDFLTNDITDVWVYVDDNLLGAYSLPKDGSDLYIPILAEGKHRIDLEPGIKYNGMAATRDYYRFYTYSSDTLDLVAGETYDLGKKDVMYNSSAIFACTYFFEDSFTHFMNMPTASTIEQPNNFTLISNDSVKYGNGCLAMYSGSKDDTYKIMTRDSISCTNTYAMILELDYHANIPFEVGLYGKVSSSAKDQAISVMRLKANNDKDWQKMYIILGKVWKQLDYNAFQLYFQPFNTNNIANGYVHIDNIKVIHFPE